MTNIVLITNGSRPRLLEQTLRTLFDNTPTDQFRLTIVTDGLTAQILLRQVFVDNYPKWDFNHPQSVSVTPACSIIGRLKNLGAYWSEKQFGRGEWLCFIDDDVAFTPGWLEQMDSVMSDNNQVRILGGVRHPFHKPNEVHVTWHETDAVAGYCHFMRWSTWDRFGPYDAHAKGTGQSEDFAICRKIVDAGGKVGYIHPPVMAHCGITDSNDKTVLGAELIERVEGILYL